MSARIHKLVGVSLFFFFLVSHFSKSRCNMSLHAGNKTTWPTWDKWNESCVTIICGKWKSYDLHMKGPQTTNFVTHDIRCVFKQCVKIHMRSLGDFSLRESSEAFKTCRSPFGCGPGKVFPQTEESTWITLLRSHALIINDKLYSWRQPIRPEFSYQVFTDFTFHVISPLSSAISKLTMWNV